MKYLLFALTAIFVCACTDYQGDWADKYGAKYASAPSGDEEGGVATFDSYDDLPSCTVKKEGLLAQITGDEGTTVCHNKKWVYNISVFNTEDDMPSCSKKRNGFFVYVTETKSLQTCNAQKGKWVDADEAEAENEGENSDGNSGESNNEDSGENSGENNNENGGTNSDDGYDL